MTDKPTDEALENLFVEETGFDIDDFPAAIFDFARAVLAKWGQPAQAEEPVAWLRNTTDQIADYVADNWPMRKYDLSEIEQRLRMLASAPSGPARVPLTRERVKEIVRGAGYDQCGIPDTERAAFINGLRHGERAHGIGETP